MSPPDQFLMSFDRWEASKDLLLLPAKHHSTTRIRRSRPEGL
jgi:hypothetical protein